MFYTWGKLANPTVFYAVRANEPLKWFPKWSNKIWNDKCDQTKKSIDCNFFKKSYEEILPAGFIYLKDKNLLQI